MALQLEGLEGDNPLGFLAALGVLQATVASSAASPTLHWTDELVPHAVLAGVSTVDELVDLLDNQRSRTRTWISLHGPGSASLSDVKASADELHAWAEASARADAADLELFSGLVAEGAYDRKGVAKPTHLHFTAGQQKFLAMARELEDRVDADRLREAIVGPWRYDSSLPSFRWDAGTERLYALTGTKPSDTPPPSVPGAEWLALLGLGFYPVGLVRTGLQTPGCDRSWKRGNFRWPLWAAPLSVATVRSLVSDPSLVSERRNAGGTTPAVLAARGVLRIMEAPIRRNANGGRGNFSAATVVARGRGGVR